MIEKLKTEDWLIEEKCAEKINELIDHLNNSKPTLKSLLTDEVIEGVFPFISEDRKDADVVNGTIEECRQTLKEWRDGL